MRDPQRIDRLLSELRAAWVADPDLRLGQLITIAAHPTEPQPLIFYVEDDLLLEGLRRYRAQRESGRAQ